MYKPAPIRRGGMSVRPGSPAISSLTCLIKEMTSGRSPNSPERTWGGVCLPCLCLYVLFAVCQRTNRAPLRKASAKVGTLNETAKSFSNFFWKKRKKRGKTGTKKGKREGKRGERSTSEEVSEGKKKEGERGIRMVIKVGKKYSLWKKRAILVCSRKKKDYLCNE